jgi:hypothetical protein
VKLRERREKQKEAATTSTQAFQASTLTQASQASNILDTNEYPDSPTQVCV